MMSTARPALFTVGSLFAAFLGHDPIGSLLGASGVLHDQGVDAATLTGGEFPPQLISGPFHHGLVVVFTAAAIMSVVAAVASLVEVNAPCTSTATPVPSPRPRTR